MPYKRKGNTVYVKKAGNWKALKTHKTAVAAEKHKRALYANVRK